MKGKDCPFLHPERCKKLLVHGTKQPDGCNLGRKCQHFHPKMCPSSITKRVCLDEKCQLTHVKGTNRKQEPKIKNKPEQKKSTETTTSRNVKANEKSSSSGAENSVEENVSNPSFLAMVSLLKQELCEAMDTKIAIAMSQFHQFNPRMQQSFYPTPFQFPMTPYPTVPPPFPPKDKSH